MKLYIGGSYQGKREYVLSVWQQEHSMRKTQAVVVSGETIVVDELLNVDVLNHFHLLVRRLLEVGKSESEVMEVTRAIIKKYPDLWIICDEVGKGIVPVEAFERKYREVVGRCCCEIAVEAEQVVRVICGIGVKLKD